VAPPYDGGVRPGAGPPQRNGTRFGVDTSTPFGRLALTHILATGGDALVALALAGSLFFSVDPSGARWRIALYLVFTMAPFALVGPLIGPAMDRARGGRRWMVTGSTVGRALVAVLMVSSVASDSILLFPEAFVMLVLSKSYHVARAAIVPTVVSSDAALVEANSKLQLLSGIAAFAAGIPGALVLWLLSPAALALAAAVVFALATAASMRIPATTVAAEPEDSTERAELRSAGVLAAASAMGTLRWVVGFVTFVLAFALRGEATEPGVGAVTGRVSAVPGAVVDAADLVPSSAPPVWHFGVVVALTGVGGLVGAALAPQVRRRVEEELLLLGALAAVVLAGVAGLFLVGLPGQAMLALLVAVGATAGKQAFDALVQRDAPDANRGRSFARFESRFQVVWVLGAAIPVVVTIPSRFGGVVVAAVAGAATAFWFVSMRAVRSGEAPPKIPDARTVGRAARVRGRRITRRPGGDADAADGSPEHPD
jgi:hypothetical protein